ncbi:unnamed protein product [Brassica rapa subsp. narinosa]
MATCMQNLQQEKLAINLQITGPWLQEYQIIQMNHLDGDDKW